MAKKTLLSTVLGITFGSVGGAVTAGNLIAKKAKKWEDLSNKHLSLFLLTNEWLKIKQEGKSIREYFEQNNYKSVAVYGLSYIGERVLDELKDSGIEVKYAIDRNADSIYADVDLYSVEDELPSADVIVVTAVYFYDEIYNNLLDKVSCPIVSLEDILYEIS
ncbi:MAG: hypothetical protein HFI10_11285 [Lachnospiraceae bacterium]|nr:hypothetical protein [Lachnospiraceae bacterium]